MARFRFQLETLRRLRQMHRDEMRGRLAEAYEAERILSEQQQAIAGDAAALAERQRLMMTSGRLNVNELLESQRYQLALQAHSRQLAEQAARLADEVENRRLAVVEADRQVRVLDQLEAKQREARQKERTAAEQKLMDEAAVVGWGRRNA